MKKIAIFASSTTTVQIEAIEKLIANEPTNAFFVQGAKLKGENVTIIPEPDRFLDVCGDADDLILIGESNFIIEEKMLNSFYSYRLGSVWHLPHLGRWMRVLLSQSQ